MHVETIEHSARLLAALPLLSTVLGHELLPTMDSWLAWSEFWQNVVCQISTRCWVWTGKVDRDGYGNRRARGPGNGVAKTHRIAYTWLVGPIPVGMTLDHLCRNPSCVNPEHLEVVTPAENSRRARTKARCLRGHLLEGANVIKTANGRRCKVCQDSYYARNTERVLARHKARYDTKADHVVLPPNGERTQCKWGHPFDEKNTRFTSTGVRQCRACAARRDRERYAKDPERKADVKRRAHEHRQSQKESSS